LIALGHSPADVWEYTPRVIWGFLQFAEARKKREAGDLLSLSFMAARGDQKELKKMHKELTK
jgi:hypothetical protein